MESSLNSNNTSFPVFKGLQKPLDFMGIQGRYIYWAAASIGGAILGFIVIYCLMGFLIGMIFLITALSMGSVIILLKQRKGLHSKKEDKGVFIYTCSKRI